MHINVLCCLSTILPLTSCQQVMENGNNRGTSDLKTESRNEHNKQTTDEKNKPYFPKNEDKEIITKTGDNIYSKVNLPKIPGTQKDKSNAHNFVDAASSVDPRTGALSFSLTVGHLITGHRRFQLKLIYNQGAALAGDNVFGIGEGWSLSLPWFIRRLGGTAIINMGDGSKYTLEYSPARVFLPFRYYDTRDVNVSYVPDDLGFSVEKKGDIYYLDGLSGMPKNLTTREGFNLVFTYRNFPVLESVAVSNGTDYVLNLTLNRHKNGTFITTQTSMGTIKYETQWHQNRKLAKIICHSCTGPSNTFTFKQFYYGLIWKIEHPSGLIENITYTEFGDIYLGTAYGVSKLIRYPGTNKDLLDRKASTEVQATYYNYNPHFNRHDYLGTDFAIYRRDRDALLEKDGVYEYATLKQIVNTCTLQYFNKMHLKTKVVIVNCNEPVKPLKRTLYEYPCPSIYSYRNMKMICKFFMHYSFPTKITNEYYGETGVYTETTKHTYDDYGNILSTTKPTGEIKVTKYLGTTKRAGKLMLPIFKSHKPASRSKCPEQVVDYWYESIPKWNTYSQFYKLESKRIESHVNKKGIKQTIRVTKKQHYAIGSDVHCYGRVKEERKSDSNHSPRFVANSYKYKAKYGKLTTIITKSQSQSSEKLSDSKIEDLATGLKLVETKTDKSKIIQHYDLEGRVTGRIIRSTCKKDKDIKVTYVYHREKDRNTKTTTYADGRVKIFKYDNAKHALEQDIFENEQPFAVNGMSYNFKWKKSTDRQIFKNQANPKKIDVLETTFHYDLLDRITEKEKPNGVIDMTKYDAHRDGKLTISYLKNRARETIPKCTVERYGKEIREAQLYEHKYNPNSPCSALDSLHVDLKTYDGYNRLHTEQTVTYQKMAKTAKEITSYGPNGFVKSKKSMYHGYNLLNTHLKYDVLFKKSVQVNVKKNGIVKHIAKKRLDGFGRDLSEIYEGVITKNTYNNKGQLEEIEEGDRAKSYFEYDGFGRKRQLTGNVQHDKNARFNATWKFLDSGKTDKIEIRQGDKTEKTKKIRHLKKFQYDTILGDVNMYNLKVEKGRRAKQFGLSKTHDLIGRIITDYDFLGYQSVYNYSSKGQLKKMAIKKGSEEYFLKFYYNEFGELYFHILNVKGKPKGYSTLFGFDKYQRVANIIYMDIDKKEIGRINYCYDNFDQIVGKNFNNKETEEKYSYDSLDRITTYFCKEYKKKPQWGCPQFTDGLKPSSKNSYMAAQQFKYDQMNNIVSVSTKSSENERVNMIYNYMADTPTVLESVVFTRKNMPEVKKKLTQRYLYDSCGNVAKIITERVEDYKFKYDGIGHTYLSIHNGYTIGKRHDEEGNLYYHLSKKGSKSNEKLLLHDDENSLRSEWGSKRNGSYAYVEDRKTIWISDHNWKYYCLDDAGSVVSSLGEKEEQHFTYSPFGCSYRNASAEPIGFQNMWTDEDDLIVTENGRTYAPWIGRFLQRDPLSPFGDSGIEGYVFAENSPISGGDPSGEIVELITSTAASAATSTVTSSVAATASASASASASVAASAGAAGTSASASGAAASAAGTQAAASSSMSVSSATATSTNLVSVSDLTVGEVTSLGGTCGHTAYVGQIQAVNPSHIVNKVELTKYGSSINPVTGGRGLVAPVENMGIVDKFGPANQRLTGPLSYRINNEGKAPGQFAKPTIERIERAAGGTDRPILMRGSKQFSTLTNDFTKQSHGVTITKSSTPGSVQSSVTGTRYNTIMDFNGRSLDSYMYGGDIQFQRYELYKLDEKPI